MSAQPDNPQFSTLNSRLLKQYWGYDRFRGIQEDIINSISENKDTLGLMPTGGGKSITFQVPALAKDGLCLVITPLIALMKDQVQNLRKRGIKALAIYSGMNRQDIITTLENCIFGNYKFLYISPERLDTEIFRIKLRKMKVSMITVDGLDSYRNSGSREGHPNPLAFPPGKCIPHEFRAEQPCLYRP